MSAPRALLGAGASALVLAVAAPAAAQESRQEIIRGKHRTYESPQHFAAELRFAPFQPDVDSDPSLGSSHPFRDTFGPGPNLLGGLELDWQALRIPHFGTIGPGAGIEYSKMSGPAQFQSPHPLPNGGTTTTSGESTSLEIWPIYAVAVARADFLWHDYRIPFVPYAKFGLGYGIWRASNSLGTSTYNGKSGSGASLGTHLALGLALNLNLLDEYAAKNFDDAMGVNNTYLFGEYTREDLNGLGVQSNPMRVGGQRWTLGLAFEF